VQSGGFILRQLDVRASSAGGGTTRFDATAELARGRAVTAGEIRPASSGFDVVLDRLDLTQNGLRAGLAAPVTLTSRQDGLTISAATLRLSQGGAVTVEGRAGDNLDLRVSVDRLPASLANLASADLGASGTLSGNATVGGTAQRPTADFRLTGQSLSAAALRSAGVPPLQLEASGRLADQVVDIEASLRGNGGLAATAAGRIPLSGGGLNVSVRGTVPLALANAALATRGARLNGTARIDARVTGSVAAPRVEGGVDISGASFTDPDSGTRLSSIAGRFAFAGDRLRIERLSARTEGNGTLSVTGSVGLTGELPADLAIALRNARLSDGRILVAQLSGDLRVTGAVLNEPTLSGRIRVERAEITIPERFARNAALLGVKHLAPPPEVRRTLARVRTATSDTGEDGRVGGIRLDLAILAPSRIFVRGRGIDAELGGEVRLTGPISAVSPVGAFRLRRGAINVIGQRITLDSGEVRLEGDLDPTIDFVATTRARTLVVTARVTGQASDPQIVLSSVPELPQDEVLAQFLFGHSISDLSPFQVIQLATAVAQLAGGSGTDLLSSIRKSTGLDALSITTDARGNAAVQAGRYISRRVYLGVTTGAGGETNAAINLDITRNLKARAEAGTAGTGAGIYYEREY
jgi:translocation and assembly module TamB